MIPKRFPTTFRRFSAKSYTVRSKSKHGIKTGSMSRIKNNNEQSIQFSVINGSDNSIKYRVSRLSNPYFLVSCIKSWSW